MSLHLVENRSHNLPKPRLEAVGTLRVEVQPIPAHDLVSMPTPRRLEQHSNVKRPCHTRKGRPYHGSLLGVDAKRPRHPTTKRRKGHEWETPTRLSWPKKHPSVSMWFVNRATRLRRCYVPCAQGSIAYLLIQDVHLMGLTHKQVHMGGLMMATPWRHVVAPTGRRQSSLRRAEG